MSREAKTTRTGELSLDLATKLDAGIPYVYTLRPMSRTCRASTSPTATSVTVHPADWYIGVRRPNYFLDQKAGLKTELIAISPSGEMVPGVPIDDHADAGAVEQRPPGGRQRLLRLGDREEARAGRLLDGHQRPVSRCPSKRRCRTAATSSSRRPHGRTQAATRSRPRLSTFSDPATRRGNASITTGSSWSPTSALQAR